MKKITKICFVLLLVAGCSNKPNVEDKTVLTCTQQKGESSSITSFTEVNDEIVESTIQTTIVLPSMDEVETLQKELEAQKTAFEKQEGITFTYTIEDLTATIESKYDVTKISKELLPQLGFDENVKVDGKFKLEKFLELYQNAGIGCVLK